MYAVEQDRSHPVLTPPPPQISMDRIPPPSSAYPTPGSGGPLRSTDHLAPVSTIHDGRIWSLQVVQQPIRARMCGFGDKVRCERYSCCCDGVGTSTNGEAVGSKTDHTPAMYPFDRSRCTDREGNRYQVRIFWDTLAGRCLLSQSEANKIVLAVKSIRLSTS